ncbi:DUF7344 domain-containing protein [Natrononativus amylolyticus]|uniref:DUF7344 domain-containing protein n=1 Tax=Natrononativus amylolyticus TaxID=2963434 RepID=UPI0020CEB638|nr:hypothetical protein [Natrononativus amylolyticus]
MSTTQTTSDGAVANDVGNDHRDETQPADLEKDDIFHILQTRRRRDALRYLQGTDEPVRMRDLAEQVAAWENETTVEQLSSDERQRVYISLYQSHLPKLDEEGIINYNQSRGIVERTPAADQFDPYLEPTDEEAADADGEGVETNVSSYYFGAAFVSTLLLLASATGLSALAGITLGAVILALFVSVTVAQRYLN